LNYYLFFYRQGNWRVFW